jgi:ribosomal protein S18 acetylase RimI-like enzyme
VTYAQPRRDTAHSVSVRPASLDDLVTLTSWVRNQADLDLWSGPRYRYPLNLLALPEELNWSTCESWALDDGGALVAFGQLMPRGASRLHIVRVITAPHRRREGLGGLLVEHLLVRARGRGATVASLNVRPGNDVALRLYRRLGFVDATRPPEDPPLPSTYLEFWL